MYVCNVKRKIIHTEPVLYLTIGVTQRANGYVVDTLFVFGIQKQREHRGIAHASLWQRTPFDYMGCWHTDNS